MTTLQNINATNNANVISITDVVLQFRNNMQATKSKIEQMQSAVDVEKAQLRAMYDDFEPLANEIRDLAGITNAKPGQRTPEACLGGGATKIINAAKKAGKPRNEARNSAIASATANAKKNYGWSELNAATLVRIDASLEKAYSKSSAR